MLWHLKLKLNKIQTAICQRTHHAEAKRLMYLRVLAEKFYALKIKAACNKAEFKRNTECGICKDNPHIIPVG